MNCERNNQGFETAEASSYLVRSCTFEIALHISVLVLTALPTITLILPINVSWLLITMLANTVAELWPVLRPQGAHVSDWTTAAFLAPLALTVAGFNYARYVKRAVAVESAENRRKPLSGPKGEELVRMVHQMWHELGVTRVKPPAVVWFANLNVLAHARDSGGVREIQVSAGLWDRLTKKDPVANVILAHEMMHLVQRDSLIFRHLSAFVSATQATMRAVGVLGCMTTLALLSEHFIVSSRRGLINLALARTLLSDLTGAMLVLAIVPVSVMVTRRYVSLISSLIEVRADTTAALRTGGLKDSVRILESDLSIRHSQVRDRIRSLLSLDLTHVSETERIDLLRSPQRLTTPKLRYFGFSLILPFLLPIGFLTPLLFGGALNHLLVAAPVFALHFALFAMIVIAAPALPAGLSRGRLFTLASGACLAGTLPHINLETIGYLLAQLSVSISKPGGFGVPPTTWQSILSDASMTLSDLARMTTEALASGKIISAIALTFLCLWWIQLRASRVDVTRTQRFWVGIGTATSGSFLVLLASYDPFRGGFYSFWPLTLAAPLSRVIEPALWLESCLPAVTALVWFELQILAVRLIARWKTNTQRSQGR